MSIQADPMSRIDMRVPLSVKETIDRAASIQGRTRSDFLIEAGLEKARQVICEHDIIRLSREDQKMLVDAILEEKATEPSPFLKDLAKKYYDMVEGK